MTAHATAVTVFRVMTIITTVLMRISLLPDFNRWRKHKSTGDMSVMPSVLIFTNCYAVLFYAYAIHDYVPLFATSSLGVVVGIVFTYCFYQWAPSKREVVQIVVVFVFVSLGITTYSVLALAGVTGQSRSSVGTTLGFITIGTTTGMYASPMATIVRVIRTKTASSMPFTMGFINGLNSSCWAVYGYLVDNMFLLAPNVVGVAMSATQMTLTNMYRAKSTGSEQVVSWTSMEGGDVPDGYEHAINVACGEQHSTKSPKFAAFRSP